MGIYCKRRKYEFKDFSSGYKGDAVELVKLLFNMSYYDAVEKILFDYGKRSLDAVQEYDLNVEEKFKVVNYKERLWSQDDVNFWIPFGIGKTVLTKYYVKPLSEFILSRDGNEIRIRGSLIYGYFKTNGELYKIYQPNKKDYKFFNVIPYVQGLEQLTYNASTLVISSSLKDMMALDGLNLDTEAVAPNSESCLLDRSVLSALVLKYDKIVTLFDNDAAGHKSMVKYEEMYGIPGIYLNLSKDLSDSIKEFGAKKTKQYLSPLIQMA